MSDRRESSGRWVSGPGAYRRRTAASERTDDTPSAAQARSRGAGRIPRPRVVSGPEHEGLDRASVERSVTEAMLERGEISIGPTEQRRLGLPDRSDSVRVKVGDESIEVAWTAGRRLLHGESLMEFLQDTARVGDLLRLERRSDGDLALVAHAPLRGLDTRAPSEVWPRPTSTATDTTNNTRARRRASRGERYRLRGHKEYIWRGRIGFLRTANEHLRTALNRRGWDPSEAVEVRLQGELLATLDQFEELLALDAAHIEHMPHQEAAARTALTRMGGRAILADEVGLGKTVEAGLVLKELMLRGLAQRILILCPSPLRNQWKEELREKFDEEFHVLVKGTDPGFDGDRLIMTPELLIRNESRFTRPFDLVIVDEAHRLAGPNAHRRRKVVGKLVADAPRALLLTATPVQNNLLELYRLVELLRPGTFLSEREFREQFVDANDPRRPVNPTELRRLVRSVITRTTREQAGVDRVRRMPPLDCGVTLTRPERTLYDMIVDALRHTMTAPGDTLRRRQLALRLTASPQAVSRSALRMAHSHPDDEVRKVLTDIGHLAGDIRHTAREQVALRVIQQWLDEHGRVLVFTQHTDTLHGIRQMLDREKIPSASFHGSMSPTARAQSVADFRSGKVRVLVSTDAGAEGQNLQVANCVLNYDLPWNPMRIEQRIGRVHRLTQERDIYIANLFARDTIDELVYRLLHDKLAMFELLFGQVVTVLGELEGEQDSTVEERILQALYEHSDQTMRERLDELGRQLKAARDRASVMMTTNSDLNGFLAEKRHARQQRAAQGQARELLPDEARSQRRRQQDVEAFVHRFLRMAGATVETPSANFSVVTLTPELSAAFDNRDRLYLAFTHAALDAHPEAELCVVGSDVFDEIMSALRERGDLTGTVARPPEVGDEPFIAHAPTVRLVERRFEPTSDWSARAVYRVQEGATASHQRLETIDVGSVPGDADRAHRVELPDGAPIPAGLTAATVLDAVETAAAGHLREQLARVRAVELEQQRQAQEQLIARLHHQLNELRYAGSPAEEQRREQLKRAIASARKATVSADDIELRAELLTLEVHGSADLVVVETWQHEKGPRREIRFPWTGAPTAPDLVCEATGRPVRTLALCVDTHIVDAHAVRRCVHCGDDRCAACGPAMVSPCPGCGQGTCGACRRETGLCPGCRTPQRAPDLDRPGEVGWRLAAGAYLRVGAHHATVVRPDGEVVTVVDDGDSRRRLRALAARFGLHPSTGLAAGPATPDDAALTRGALWHRVTRSAWWRVETSGGAAVDASVVDALPDLPAPPALTETASGLDGLLAGLRRQVPAPPAPTLVAQPFVVVERIDVEDGRLIYREHWYLGGETGTLAVEQEARLAADGHDPIKHGLSVGGATVGPLRLTVDRLHRSYLLTVRDRRRPTRSAPLATVMVEGAPGATVRAEALLAATVARHRLAPSYALVHHDWPGTSVDELGLGRAAPGVDVQRTGTVEWVLTHDDVVSSGLAPVVAPLDEFPVTVPTVVRTVADEPLRRRLDALAGAPGPVPVAPALAVDETWRSDHGQAVRRYMVVPGSPVDRRVLEGRRLVRPGEALDPGPDDKSMDVPLSVDSRGHLHDATTVHACHSCAKAFGSCCAGEVAPCPGCGRPACGGCRADERPDIDDTRCELCTDRSCRRCSYALSITRCGLCGRDACAACTAAERKLCTTCSRLRRATPEEVAALPAVLAAADLTVLVAEDERVSPTGEQTRVAVLLGHRRAEVAVIVGSEVVTWGTGVNDDPMLLAARLAVARRAGVGEVAIQAVAIDRVAVPPQALVLRRRTRDRFLWAAPDREGRPIGSVTSLPGRTVGPAGPELLNELLTALGTRARDEAVPQRRLASSPHLRKLHRAYGPYPPPVPVAVCRHTTEDIVYLGRGGLVRRANTDGATTETRADWKPSSDTPAWLTQDWAVPPVALAEAELDGVAVGLAAVGRHVMLGVRVDGRMSWRVVRSKHNDLLSAVVAHRLGSATPVSVVALTRPSDILHPVLVGARRMSWTATPFLEAADPGTPATPALAIATVARELGIAVDTAEVVPAGENIPPGDVLKSLNAMVRDQAQPPAPVRIGHRVQAVWRLADGGEMTVEYSVSGGTTQGYLVDHVTGDPVTSASVCRARHIAVAVTPCADCGEPTCGGCADAVVPCLVCEAPTCGGCVGSDGRCAVCARLAPRGFLARRLLFGGAEQVWSSPRWRSRTVTIRRLGEQWWLDRSEGGRSSSVELQGDRLVLVRQVLESSVAAPD